MWGTKGGRAGKPGGGSPKCGCTTKAMAQEPPQGNATWCHKTDKGERLVRRKNLGRKQRTKSLESY